jgi:predicted MFS family arabinose efflux permease
MPDKKTANSLFSIAILVGTLAFGYVSNESYPMTYLLVIMLLLELSTLFIKD